MCINHQIKTVLLTNFSNNGAPEPGRAADAAGAARGLGAIHPAKRYGFTLPQKPATFTHVWYHEDLGARVVSRTRIAWYLPLLHVLHFSHACQRRS